MAINFKLKKYWWLLLLFLLMMVLIVFYFSGSPVFKKKSEQNAYTPPSTAIKLEYLSSQELEALGVNNQIKAQVISRDPLVYKIINNEEDIIKDSKEILESQK